MVTDVSEVLRKCDTLDSITIESYRAISSNIDRTQTTAPAWNSGSSPDLNC